MEAPREDSMGTEANLIKIMIIMALLRSCRKLRNRRSHPYCGSRPGWTVNREIGRVAAGVWLREAHLLHSNQRNSVNAV